MGHWHRAKRLVWLLKRGVVTLVIIIVLSMHRRSLHWKRYNRVVMAGARRQGVLQLGRSIGKLWLGYRRRQEFMRSMVMHFLVSLLSRALMLAWGLQRRHHIDRRLNWVETRRVHLRDQSVSGATDLVKWSIRVCERPWSVLVYRSSCLLVDRRGGQGLGASGDIGNGNAGFSACVCVLFKHWII